MIGKSVFAIICVLYFSKLSPTYRWAIFVAIIVVFAMFSIHNKREAIFLILPMLYLTFLQSPQRASLKTVLWLVPLSGFLLLLSLEYCLIFAFLRNLLGWQCMVSFLLDLSSRDFFCLL